MEVLVTKRAYDVMVNEIDKANDYETGGILLGYNTGDTFKIVEAVDGGYNASKSKTSYTCDTCYVEHVSNIVANLYEPSLEVVGVWHKHNSMHEEPFSDEDMLVHEKLINHLNSEMLSLLFQNIQEEIYVLRAYFVPMDELPKEIKCFVEGC